LIAAANTGEAYRPSVGRQEPSLRRLPASVAAGPGPAEPAIGFGEAVPVRRGVHRDSAARPATLWSSGRAVHPRTPDHKMPNFGCRPHADIVRASRRIAGTGLPPGRSQL